MSENYVKYLQREHARLDAEIRAEQQQKRPDDLLIARLKKLKLAVKDEIAGFLVEPDHTRAA